MINYNRTLLFESNKFGVVTNYLDLIEVIPSNHRLVLNQLLKLDTLEHPLLKCQFFELSFKNLIEIPGFSIFLYSLFTCH